MRAIVMWRGAVKLAEEAAELGVEVAKLQAFPEGQHPDGRGECIERVRAEMADVIAAIQSFCEFNGIQVDWKRVDEKNALFAEWHANGNLAGAIRWIAEEGV